MRVVLICALLGTSSLAAADVLPPLPEPTCDPGYVVEWDHGGRRCARPSCQVTSDCPDGWTCPEGHCFRYVPDQPCLDLLEDDRGARGLPTEVSRNAFEPPPPCPPLHERTGGTCSTSSECDEGRCSHRRCVPPASATMSASMSSEMTEMTAMTEGTGTTETAMTETATNASSDDDASGCSVAQGNTPLGVLLGILVVARRRRFPTTIVLRGPR